MKHDNRFIVNRIILLLLITVLILSLAACGSSSDSPAVSSKDYNYKLEDSDIRTDSESGISYVSNMVIVYFSENASQQVIDDVIRDLNGEVVGHLSLVNQYQIRVETSTLEELEELCQRIRKKSGVEYCIYDTISSTDTEARIPDDPWAGESFSWDSDQKRDANWGQRSVDAPEAWALCENSSEKTIIGIIDQGIATDHPELKGIASQVPYDNGLSGDHGTHVAGIIGAAANNQTGIAGMNWNASILGYNCFDFGEELTTSTKIVNGMITLVESGAKVINVSLGSSSEVLDSHTDVLSREIIDQNADYVSYNMGLLLDKGYDFVIVQSAGNGAKDHIGVDAIYNGNYCSITSDNCNRTFGNTEDILDRIIIVGNAEKLGSSYHQALSSNGGSQVSIFAPGTEILSTIQGNSYGWDSGTSMAAPFVTAIAGMVWGMDPSLTGKEVKQAVCSEEDTRYDVTNNGDNSSNGAGRLVNAYLAVASVSEEEIPAEKDDSYRSIYEEYIADLRARSTGIEEGKLVIDLEDDPGRNDDYRELYEQYAIADLDSDGKEELLVWYDDYTQNQVSYFFVRRYNPDTGEIENVQGMSVPDIDRYTPVFYSNGVIRMRGGDPRYLTFLFVNKELASQYDFSSIQDLIRVFYALNLSYENGAVTESITGVFDVSASRTISEEEADLIVSELQSGQQLNIQIQHF